MSFNSLILLKITNNIYAFNEFPKKIVTLESGQIKISELKYACICIFSKESFMNVMICYLVANYIVSNKTLLSLIGT
jgi:hypothetical protein